MKLTLLLVTIALGVFSGATTLSAAALLTEAEMSVIRGGCPLCHSFTCGLTPMSCAGGKYAEDACDQTTSECTDYLHQQEFIPANCYSGYTYGDACSQGQRHECGRTYYCRCQTLGEPTAKCRTYQTSDREWHECNSP